MNAETAGPVGTPQLKQFLMVNTKMFRHPKYYKELRKRNKALRSCDAYSKENSNYTERQQSDQVISGANSTRGLSRVHPGPGLKQQAASDSQVVNQVKLSSQSQAASDERQATSDKPQAASFLISFPS